MELQLIKTEIAVYKAIKEGKHRLQIVEETGLACATVSHLIKKLIRLGAIEFLGRNGKIKEYRSLPCNYKEVKKRDRQKPVQAIIAPDELIEKALDLRLTDDEWFYLRQHKEVKNRTALAKRLGISKLALNFALDKLPKAEG